MHYTNKSGVKYLMGQLIQFIIYAVWALPTKCHEITFLGNNISVFCLPR